MITRPAFRAVGSTFTTSKTDPRRFAPEDDSLEPSKVSEKELLVNHRSIARTMSYGLSESHDPLHLVGLRQMRRIDQHGIRRLNRLGGVPGVPVHDQVRLLGDLRVRRR